MNCDVAEKLQESEEGVLVGRIFQALLLFQIGEFCNVIRPDGLTGVRRLRPLGGSKFKEPQIR